MTIATAGHTDHFVSAFDARDAGSPTWLTPVRKAAIARFAELGIPTTRHEDWRYTNLAALRKTDFVPASAPAAGVTLDDITPYLVEPKAWSRLVFINGRYSAELSDLEGLPRSVQVGSLAEALARDTGELKEHLTRYASYQKHALVALNTAMFEDGAFIRVPSGVVVERSIHLLFVTTHDAEPAVAHPRSLIVAGDNSELSLIESYVGLGDGVYFTNSVTEVVAGPGAKVEHYKVLREGERAVHFGMMRIEQDRDSNVSSHSLAIDGGLTRNEVHVVLNGAGADCTLNGLYVTHDQQHVDNHLRVEHAKPHCNSWEFYKGILDDKSSAVFTGRIYVHKGAQKTDAKQSNSNLLLSNFAKVDTKPQLEIFADDVRCTHGTTIGQLDSDAIFYLRSRGIPEQAARSILIYAFAGESLGQIRHEALRDQLQKIILQRLPHGELLRAGSPLFYGRDFAEHVRASDRRSESY